MVHVRTRQKNNKPVQQWQLFFFVMLTLLNLILATLISYINWMPWRGYSQIKLHPEFGNSNFRKMFWKEIKIIHKWSCEEDSLQVQFLKSWNVNLCKLSNIENRELCKLKPYNFSSAIVWAWCLPTLKYVSRLIYLSSLVCFNKKAFLRLFAA